MRDTQIVKIAKALADPTRHQMLQQIRARGELNCSQIHELFALSQPTISHHIKMLVAAGLVVCRKEGLYHVMTADEGVLADFVRGVAGPVGPAARGRTRGSARRVQRGRASAPAPRRARSKR